MSEILDPEALYYTLCVVFAFHVGMVWGAYRYEQLFHDRSIREIVRDARRDR